jgi:hypothetical protein
MIQLANDPNASRTSNRPEQNEAKESNPGAQRVRNGHAWPFLSRYAARPTQQDNQKSAASDSGS